MQRPRPATVRHRQRSACNPTIFAPVFDRKPDARHDRTDCNRFRCTGFCPITPGPADSVTTVQDTGPRDPDGGRPAGRLLLSYLRNDLCTGPDQQPGTQAGGRSKPGRLSRPATTGRSKQAQEARKAQKESAGRDETILNQAREGRPGRIDS